MKVMKEPATIVLVAPVWKIQPWWPLLLKMLEKPSSPSTDQRSSTRPYKPSEWAPTVAEFKTGRLFHIRQHYENRGLSQKTAELVLSAHLPVTMEKVG